MRVIWECQLKRKAADQTFSELLSVLVEELGKELWREGRLALAGWRVRLLPCLTPQSGWMGEGSPFDSGGPGLAPLCLRYHRRDGPV